MSGKRWTLAADEKLRAALKRGLMPADAAKELGRTVPDVIERIRLIFRQAGVTPEDEEPPKS